MSEPLPKNRARVIERPEGKYLHLGDMKRALLDEKFLTHCAAMLAVGYQNNRPYTECVQRCIGAALLTLSGEEGEQLARTQQRRN